MTEFKMDNKSIFLPKETIRKLSRPKNEIVIFIYVLSTFNMIFFPFLKPFLFASSLDEFCVIFLGVYSLDNLKIYKKKEVGVCFLILIIYLIYSLVFGVNKPIAAVYDFVITLKPFICFYVASNIIVRIDDSYKIFLKWLYVILGLYCLMIVPYISTIYGNPSFFYQACIFCAVSYIYFSDREKKDWIIALCILIPGLFSMKAKFFTEFIFFIFIGVVLKERIHINMKWALIIGVLVVLSIYVSWEKFNLYFIMGSEDTARTMFYYKGFYVLKDYMPFGSGFGSYGTEAAAKYYSPLYSKYGLAYIWGLRQIDYGGSGHDFLKDTFYPVLVQYGIVGICLYFYFWYRCYVKTMYLNFDAYKIALFVIFYEAIQNLADNSFTGPVCVPVMIMLGLLFGEKKYLKYK